MPSNPRVSSPSAIPNESPIGEVTTPTVSNYDPVDFLKNFDALTQSLISGSYFKFNSDGSAGISTVSTAGPQSSFSGLLGVSNGKTALSFKEAMDTYFNNGGTATTVNDPVMRYDFASMGKHFKAVDEKAGVYMKDGVFFVKEKLGDHEVLQPVGLNIKDGKVQMFGLSSGDLSGPQKAFAARITGLIEKLAVREFDGDQTEATRSLVDLFRKNDNSTASIESVLKELEDRANDGTSPGSDGSTDDNSENQSGGSEGKGAHP